MRTRLRRHRRLSRSSSSVAPRGSALPRLAVVSGEDSPPRGLVVLGLGNPGNRYAGTRHNVGFQVVDLLARRYHVVMEVRRAWQLEMGSVAARGGTLHLVKPLTFMNLSGTVVPRVKRVTGVDNDAFVVVCDQMDLPPGATRLKAAGSGAGHNGLSSVLQFTGSGIARIYIGVGRPQTQEQVVSHVLARPSVFDRQLMDQAVELVCDHVTRRLDEPAELVMNDLNHRS